MSSSAADFEPRVLASRCNSCIRKSSRLPISPLGDQSFDFIEMMPRRVEFLRHIDTNGEGGCFVSARSWLLAALFAVGQRLASFQRARKALTTGSPPEESVGLPAAPGSGLAMAPLEHGS